MFNKIIELSCEPPRSMRTEQCCYGESIGRIGVDQQKMRSAAMPDDVVRARIRDFRTNVHRLRARQSAFIRG